MLKRADARILLVDDDVAKRYTIARTLVRAGFVVEEADSGSEALRLVASLPDLVILDVKLPDIDGFEVCRRIKSDPASAAIPVLHISTTFVDIEDKVHGLDSGADGYLTNVAEPMELVATVRALLRARRARTPRISRQPNGKPRLTPSAMVSSCSTGREKSFRPTARLNASSGSRGPKSSAEARPISGMSRRSRGIAFRGDARLGRSRGERPLIW